MRTDDIILLFLLVGAGVTGYLLYTKQIKWPFASSNKKSEETDIVKDITGDDNTSSSKPALFDPKKIIDDAFKRGDSILDDLVIKKEKPPYNPPANPKFGKKSPRILNNDGPSLDDLITDAFRGLPFKPYSGTRYRPYG